MRPSLLAREQQFLCSPYPGARHANVALARFVHCIGEADVYGIAEFPDVVTAVAMSLAVNAGAAVQLRSTLLLSPEEFDAAAKKSIGYRPPGA